MANFFVSIVSHGHFDFISNNQALLDISNFHNVTVVVKDNVCDSKLKRFCFDKKLVYLSSDRTMGFGENNNFVYDYCCSKLSLSENDFFVVLNPDVIITSAMFRQLVDTVSSADSKIFTINLFKDELFEISENSLRKFPSAGSLVKLILREPVCEAYNKNDLCNFSIVDWASGAFLIFKASLYKKLNGFDIRYFMYYEDVDICFRAHKFFDERVCFLKDVKGVHVGAYKNRDLFSRHFLWYISSLFKFLIRKTFFGK